MHTRARVIFDEPAAASSLDVKVYRPDGTLDRIIPGALLVGRKLNHQRAPEVSRPAAKLPSVAMMKPRRREERP